MGGGGGVVEKRVNARRPRYRRKYVRIFHLENLKIITA